MSIPEQESIEDPERANPSEPCALEARHETWSGRSEASSRGRVGAAWSLRGFGRSSKLVLVGLVVLCGVLVMTGGHRPWTGPEDQAPQYQKHQDVTSGALASGAVAVSSGDIDRDLTRLAIGAARKGDRIPGQPDLPKPVIDRLKDGEVTFYKLHFFDTCAEDGDFISVTVNGTITYPAFMITHAGTTVSIPVINGTKPQAVLNAVRDGQGGVTVGCRTQDGTWYSGVLPPGASQPIPITGA